jgi:hypothetical protein
MTGTKRDAEAYERQVRAEFVAGTYGKGPAPSFEAFAKEFMKVYVEANNSPSEIDTKRRILRLHLVPHFGPMPLDEIGRAAPHRGVQGEAKEGRGLA